jgi:chromosome partitioning protein
MSAEIAPSKLSARIIVVGNEKGGSGKSTVAMNLAIALIKAGQRIASIDLDSRQSTFTHYIEYRYAWAQHIARDLEIPNHLYFTENTNYPTVEDEAADGKAFLDNIETRARGNDSIVIDTPGHNSYVGTAGSFDSGRVDYPP